MPSGLNLKARTWTHHRVPAFQVDRDPRRNFHSTAFQPCAHIQRLPFGGVCRLRSTLKSGEHHG